MQLKWFLGGKHGEARGRTIMECPMEAWGAKTQKSAAPEEVKPRMEEDGPNGLDRAGRLFRSAFAILIGRT